jgi:carbon-monoxide dehydrogenase medium subunit
VKPAPFRYERPDTLESALALLSGHGSPAGGEDRDVRPLAGGQSLVPLLALRLVRPTTLVDLNRLVELQGIAVQGDVLRVGAMTRHEVLLHDELVRQRAPLLAHGAGHIGHRAIRTRGTIGGSLAHADPAAELPVVCLALGAEVEVAGPHGRRTLPVTALLDGPLSTTLAPGELIVAVRFPLAGGRRPFGFAELARRHGDFAVVLAAVTTSVDADGGCRAAAVAVGGVGGAPKLVGPAARALIGTRLDDASVERAVHAVLAIARPSGDLHGSAAYRRAMIAVMTRRAITAARGGR